LSDDKKDLTRIEDLGEFIHELNEEENVNEELEKNLPEIPQEENAFETPFNTESEDFSFNSTNEVSNEDFSSSDFSTSESSLPFENSETTSFSEDPFSTENADSTINFDQPSSFSSDSESNEEIIQDEPLFEEESRSFTSTSESFQPDEDIAVQIENFEEPQVLEPAFEKTPLVETKEESSVAFIAPENFSDLKQFAENTNFSGMASEGNPSFSVLLSGIRFVEDVNDILLMLKELGLMGDAEDQAKARLMRGTFLVPRISEYAAILLTHKLRRFDIDIQMGLSDDIHPPKHGEKPETGIVSKHSLYQNKTHQFHFDEPKLDISQIIVATTSNIDGYQVLRYLGVASEHKFLDGHIVEDETSSETPKAYQELAQKLKAHALKAHANAVMGLNYQLTPLPSEFSSSSSKYRLSCTGNLVWVNKL
jgi:hypothetical protein